MIIALLISLFLLLGMPLMGQNPPIALPADGDWPTIVGDSIMLIGPKQEALTEEQRYFNPPYLLIYPGKEHLTAQMIRATICDCDPTKPNRRIGVFSVAPDKQVSFSQGNLQYLPAANIWKFADTQYEFLGNANKYLKPTFRNWVDLFGWSANNTTAPFGVSTSTNVADYAGDFVDWGTNEICGDAPGTWRTLSKEEWEYLLNGRENASQLRTKGSVEGKEGVILLPENWICPEGYTIAIIPDEANLQSNVNTYSQADWSKLEAAGAIILPSAGMRRNATELEVRHTNIFGGYWTCTNKDEHNSYCYTFHTQDCEYMDYSNHIYGRSVRLVHDTIVSTPEPEYVDLGLSVKWATFNVGATSPEDYGDYFAWGETEPKEEYTWENYKWCDGDYTKLNKYCTKEQYGMVDNQTILQPCDDAAHTKLGGNWRMPTMEECQELVNLCSWTWTTINGINGHVITGPNGNTIFLPATGAITTSGLAHAGQSGYYWINSISTTNPYNANDIYNRPPDTEMEGALPTYGINAFSRYIGRPIRPVYDDIPTPKIIWYTDEAIKEGSNGASITGMAGWAYLHPEGMETTELNRRYQGKRINCIRLQVAKEGTFTVSVANRDRLDSIFNIQTIMLKNPSKEPQVYHLPQTIHLQKNQVLVFANPTDQARFYYSSLVGDISFADYVGHPTQPVRITGGPKTLNIDAGYYCEDGENCDTTAIPEPEYVDLGLSVKWATFNVGATSPEDYGDYFAWGETEPKETYSWATYKWCNGTDANITKYNATDGKTILEPADDAAHVNWGGKWRMPTKAECQELIDSCTWERTNLDGVIGYKVTGPNGNSIFIPIAGAYNSFDNQLNSVGSIGWIYSSTRASGKHAYQIHFEEGYVKQMNCSRCVGLTIRPVYDDSN